MSSEPLLSEHHSDIRTEGETCSRDDVVHVGCPERGIDRQGPPETSGFGTDSVAFRALYSELTWMKAIYFLGNLGGSCWGRFAQVSGAQVSKAKIK